jgi:hypothetical protein
VSVTDALGATRATTYADANSAARVAEKKAEAAVKLASLAAYRSYEELHHC